MFLLPCTCLLAPHALCIPLIIFCSNVYYDYYYQLKWWWVVHGIVEKNHVYMHVAI